MTQTNNYKDKDHIKADEDDNNKNKYHNDNDKDKEHNDENKIHNNTMTTTSKCKELF